MVVHLIKKSFAIFIVFVVSVQIKVVAAQSVCRDIDYRCRYWVAYCRQSYTRSRCQATCRACPPSVRAPTSSGGCVDSRRECPDWGRRGECEKNPAFMLKSCQKSCSCCQDRNAQCYNWVRTYGCAHAGVKASCRKSCQSCGPIAGTREPSPKRGKKPHRGKKPKPPHKRGPHGKRKHGKGKHGHEHGAGKHKKGPKPKPRPRPKPEPKRTPPPTRPPVTKPIITNPPPPKTVGPPPVIDGARILKDSECGNRFILLRTVGGRRANVAEWPWMVGIATRQNPTIVFCGGTLIGREWILTAAHCWLQYPNLGPKDFVVRVSDLNTAAKDLGEEIISTRDIFNHKGFNQNNYDNDISIIRLSKSVKYSKVARPLCIPEQNENKFPEGTQCRTGGWGLLQEDGVQADYLQIVQIPLTNRQACVNQYKKINNEVTSNMICAGDGKGEKDACQGDSGGPLFCRGTDRKYYQAGIVSWGHGCARKGFYGVYTHVSKYRKWIEDSITMLLKS